MKKIIIIISLFILTGCYNYTEINSIKLVNGIYIDYKNNKYIGYFDIKKNINVEASSINELFRNFEESISKNPFYAHLKVLVISKEILTHHFDDVIEFFLRNNEIRNNFYLVVSDDIKNLDSDYIKNILTNENLVPTSTLFKDILTSYLGKKNIIVPIIKENNKKYLITGSVIKSKNKYKEYNLDETRLLRIIYKKYPNVNYKNINIYQSKIKNKDKVYVYLNAELKDKSKTDIKNDLKNDLKKIIKDIYNKELILKMDINRNGQILNHE